MKATMVCLVTVAGILTGAPAGVWVSLSIEQTRPEMTCEPGSEDCEAPERRLEETAPHAAGPEHHPCDWVETCQLPCGREGGECCHAEWNCPPDANLPRC
ncbi:hypothetical protein [Archangium sp.]|uniref:hypothetical protein n=1 Tax=Archangium sp. TaxID=1872627 RepID=UPI002D662A1C|nr:hypothetical protein [Archangium sp.]HYO57821.1 hypothetical protein [Archangium sp.]